MRRRALSGSRGAVVHAAVVTPLLVVIVLGVAELAVLMRDNVALTSLTREAVRTAATAASGPAGRTTEDAPALAAAAALAVQRAGTALPKGAVEELWVYLPDEAGYPTGSASDDRFATCGTDCLVYRWDPDTGAFALTGGSWTMDDDVACRAGSVGVYLKADHRFLTRIFAGSTGISRHAAVPVASYGRSACAGRG